jgi:hypothetical protein
VSLCLCGEDSAPPRHAFRSLRMPIMKIARLVSLLIGLVLIPLAAFGDTLKLNGSTVGDLSITSGTLEVAGFSEATSLTLGPAAQYIVDLNATFWDKTIDYLAVRGNVSLGGATLVLNRVSVFPGQTHTIIRNDGPNPIDGTFQGLPEGAWFIQSQFLYRITYHGGGSGRDVAVVLPFNTSAWLFYSRSTTNWGSPLTLTAHVIASPRCWRPAARLREW